MTPDTIITLSRSQDVPFEQLVLSERNVRRIQTGLSIEDLAEDIARRTLLQSLSVRPILERDGFFEVQAGGRRYRALALLVKQGRLPATAPIPCIVREDGLLEEDSLAENVQRRNLHPLDQFRAFQNLREQGLGEEEIAARFFVTPQIVKQRLKLASISPQLLEVYAGDAMTLEQLMAFAVCDDLARQEQVWESISQGYNKSAGYIRRLLTEHSIAADDARVLFVGLSAYEAAGGRVLRDLFSEENDGWIEDAVMLEHLFTEKLNRAAETVRAEGWSWVQVAESFPYGHTRGMRRLTGDIMPMSAEETAEYDALVKEKEEIERQYFQDEGEEIPDEVERQLTRLDERIDELDDRPVVYDPADINRAGAFVSINNDGSLVVERGFVQREDDVPGVSDTSTSQTRSLGAMPKSAGTTAQGCSSTEPEEEGVKPLSDRLMMELTAHRTLALRDALAKDPDVAFLAALHALVFQSFYPYAIDSCLEVTVKSASFSVQGPELKTCASAQSIDQRHANWQKQLPKEPKDLWTVLQGFDADSRAALFAHCIALSVNALREPWNKGEGRQRDANQLAEALTLDLSAAGWKPTAANYLGRISKPQIIEAVREAKGASAASLIEHMRKSDMAEQAERMLADTNWLPEPLRTPGFDPIGIADHASPQSDTAPRQDGEDDPSDVLPAFLRDVA